MTVLRNELGEDRGTPTAVSFGDERLVGTEAEQHLQVTSESVAGAVLVLARCRDSACIVTGLSSATCPAGSDTGQEASR